MRTILSIAAAVFAFALGAPNIASAQPGPPGDPCANVAGCVENGSDYFATQAGSSDNIPGIGPVQFMGVPITGATIPQLAGFNIWNTDTIVQRTTDIQINGAAGPLEMKALQLESTGPVAVPGMGNIPIFISLQCNNVTVNCGAGATLSTGNMTIHGGLGGGTFDSTLNVFFDVCTAAGVDGVGCGAGALLGQSNITLTSSGTPWSPTPGPFDVLVPGMDCNNANGSCDSDLSKVPTGLFTNDWDPASLDSGETNFFVGGTIHTGPHPVDPASIPEPASLALLGTGLLPLVPLRRRWRRG